YPKDDYEFWLYLAHSLVERKIPIPEFLKSVTDFEPIRQALAEMARHREIGRWKQNLQKFSANRIPPAANGRIDFRLMLLGEEARLEWRMEGETAFKQLKSAVSKRFAEESADGTLEIVPEAFPLWHGFAQRYHNKYAWVKWKNELRYDDVESRAVL